MKRNLHFWDGRKIVEHPVKIPSKHSDRTLFTLLGWSKIRSKIRNAAPPGRPRKPSETRKTKEINRKSKKNKGNTYKNCRKEREGGCPPGVLSLFSTVENPDFHYSVISTLRVISTLPPPPFYPLNSIVRGNARDGNQDISKISNQVRSRPRSR